MQLLQKIILGISTNSLSVPEHKICVPRKEYKTITVKVETHARFLKAVHDAKKYEAKTDNSKFLDLLLNTYKRSKTR